MNEPIQPIRTLKMQGSKQPIVDLTTEFMSQYIGGQMEIIGGDGLLDGYRFRGQIKNLAVVPQKTSQASGEATPGQQATLKVDFEYVCKFDTATVRFKSENADFFKSYEINLSISAVSDIGRGPNVNEGVSRLCVNCPLIGEMMVFYSPQHDRRVLENGDFVGVS